MPTLLQRKNERLIAKLPRWAANAFCPTGEGGGIDPTCGGMLYHGTDSDAFDKFDEKKFGSATDEGFMGSGVYLSTDRQTARSSKRVASVIADLKKPLSVSMMKWTDDKNKIVRQTAGISESVKGAALTDRLKQLGHDGVVLDYSKLGYNHKEVVVFSADKVSVKTWSDVTRKAANEITESLLAANELLIRSLNPDGSPFESKNPNTRHAATVLLRTAQLQSVGNWFDEQAANRLNVLEKELLALLRMDDPTDDDEATLDRLFASAASRIKYAYADIQAETKAELEKLSGILKERGMADISAVHDVKSKHGKLPDFARMPVLGLTLAEHFKAQADGMALKFKAAVRAGLAAKDTLDGLIERVIGTPGLQAANAFCPTGEGGGIDPTCGSGEGGSSARTDSKEFKVWFGDSKVVDEGGKPLVVYHGTAKDVGQFGEDRTHGRAGIYFTDSPELASHYATISQSGTPNIIPVFVSIKNPAPLGWRDMIQLRKEDVTELQKQGYDGIIADNPNGTKEFVAFKPEQIKSKFNKGTWSKTDKNITNEITDDHFINAEVTSAGVVVRSRLVDAAQNSFGKMIQSAIQTVANYVEKGVFDGAADGDKATMGWEWNALHDGHVICPECEALDGQRWTADFEKVDPQGMEWPGFGQRHFGCLCSQLNVDLESESVPKTPLDTIFQAQDKESLDASFGKANTEAFLDGRINGRQLLQQDTWKLSPEALAELRGAV